MNKENTDFYVDDAQEEEQGYVGDSLEAAAKNKRKTEEEQKKKAAEQARQAQQAQQKTSSQVSLTNQKWILPVSKGHKITSKFGKRIPPVPGASAFHNGWDIDLEYGTPIKAIADGKIIAVGPAKGYGYWVVIDHGIINGTRVTSEYGHISSWNVIKGQIVKAGETIAKSGNAGYSTGPHLHITIREGTFQGKAVDPSKYIKNLF